MIKPKISFKTIQANKTLSQFLEKEEHPKSNSSLNQTKTIK